MASNSSKPNAPKNSNNHTSDSDANQHPKEKLTDDLDFWSMDTDEESIEAADIELDEVAEFLKSPVLPIGKTKSLSEISDTPAELKEIDDADILENLTKANSRKDIENTRSLSDEDLEEFQNLEDEEHQITTVKRQEKKESKKKRSPLELATTIACFLFLIGLGVFFYQYYNEKFDVLTDDKWASNIPVEGKYAEIEAVETWWSEPVTQAKLGVVLVPCIKITLGENTKSGALRLIFFSSEKGLSGNLRAKGDPFPLEFSNGKFSNGKKSITLQGTDGFESMAEYSAYRIQDKERWTVTINEGASIELTADDYTDLGHAPIEPIFKTLKINK